MIERDLKKLKEKAKYAYQKNDHLKATLYLEEILALEPQDLEAHFLKANICHLQGKIGKAIHHFKKVVELDPDHTDAMISLSVILNDIGKYKEAQKYFTKVDQKVEKGDHGVIDSHINKKFSFHHYEIAEMYYSYSRYDEALFEYNKAKSLDETNLMIRLKIAKVYIKKGFISKAFEELRRLKAEFPNFLQGRMELGLLHYNQGNIIEAQKEWNLILAKDANFSQAKMYLNLSQSASETNLF